MPLIWWLCTTLYLIYGSGYVCFWFTHFVNNLSSSLIKYVLFTYIDESPLYVNELVQMKKNLLNWMLDICKEYLFGIFPFLFRPQSTFIYILSVNKNWHVVMLSLHTLCFIALFEKFRRFSQNFTTTCDVSKLAKIAGSNFNNILSLFQFQIRCFITDFRIIVDNIKFVTSLEMYKA